MPDASLGLVAHPLAVVAHILGKPPRTLPFALDQRRLVGRSAKAGFRVDRRPAGELRWNLDHGFVDEHRYRIEVASMSFKPQPLRFQRQRAAARERIVKRR